MKIIRTAALVAAASAAYNKAKDYARENPDKASGHIDKVEGFVRGKASPKYAGKVGQGGDAVRKGLGLSAGGAIPPPSGPAGIQPTSPPASPNPSTNGFDPSI